MADKPVKANQQGEDRFQTLLNNANAARVISQAVEGTLGPRGLDVMMVDRFGGVVITNDGVTILNLMEVGHPAAQMIINTARSQQKEVGDGTTTTTILAGAMIAEGCAQVLKGVPVTRIVEGIRLGVEACSLWIDEISRPITDLDDPELAAIAKIAGRGEQELAGQIIEGAKILGKDMLLNPEYKYADAVYAREAADNKVFRGVVINKQPVNREMPRQLQDAIILVIDDALAPEEINVEALKTEAGFQYYRQSREDYKNNLARLGQMGVNMVLVDRSIDDIAEEILTDANIMVLQRVSSRELERLCRHTGARKVKRTALNRDPVSLRAYLGRAEKVIVDEKLEGTMVLNGKGESQVTVLVGAATTEVVDERERMARDAAAAVQAALKGGVVPGGGALEVWLSSRLEDLARQQEGLISYGILCVKEALTRTFLCMAANAGFNPLEKLGDITAMQRKHRVNSISFDVNTGQPVDMVEVKVLDPALVKCHAIEAAGEVAAAILRIETVIKMKDETTDHPPMVE
ncbi:MAG TPA: TCP-1/cpn60 chaperonin family protein [Syntrophomonadaceae bacterium]|mgnify:FL=1|nr:TCP-1/cpn60 chaperonin family protein [Syntrophomonadaceae bacterium]HQA06750.1 TCP-1/cpn60 chaperonin family protein [Syntrophomonadaceae bacterium]HQE22617.1 TCP-1/cpn60 chaperonin family protein [Syntrophomonadaceae bacterium]